VPRAGDLFVDAVALDGTHSPVSAVLLPGNRAEALALFEAKTEEEKKAGPWVCTVPALFEAKTEEEKVEYKCRV